MLVKLAFVMQRLKISKKIFVMINKDGGDNFLILWGDTAVMRGDIELMGVPLQSPPTRENPGSCKPHPTIQKDRVSYFLIMY